MRRVHWLLAQAVLAPVVSTLHATEYLTLEQAQKALFPEADRFDRLDIALSKEQRKEIQKAANASAPGEKPNVWKALKGGAAAGYVWVDRAIGKHEFITFAVGLSPDGGVRNVEIMDYRETYGGEVRRQAWRDQFTGKTAADPLALDKDIQNISGATLSCRNVTRRVRRILAAHAVAFPK
jgi:Na+-translocating ferredoxin:NAD+ oxidoreductase RnfG subunit